MEIEDVDCRSFICWAVGRADGFSFHPILSSNWSNLNERLAFTSSGSTTFAYSSIVPTSSSNYTKFNNMSPEAQRTIYWL